MGIKVHLLGDSTFDNLVWVDCDEEKSVKGQLEKLLHQKVNDLSFDGFTTEDVLAEGNKKQIGSVLGFPSRYQAIKANGRKTLFVKPLEELKVNIEKEPNKRHYVVISVGGNDFRENLSNPLKFIADIPKIQKRHREILEKVQGIGLNVKPIIMMQYRTDRNNDPYKIYDIVLKVIGIGSLILQGFGGAVILSSLVALIGVPVVAAVSLSSLVALIWIVGIVAAPILIGVGVLAICTGTIVLPPTALSDVLRKKDISMLVFGSLLQKFYRPILNYAKDNKISVLDLPNTMNPNKPLFKSGIEPNEVGGALIAKGIHHIITNFDDSKSMIYSTNLDPNDRYVARENDPKNYKVIYPDPINDEQFAMV